MSSDKPVVDGTYLLEKFPGKGGWTYASIPEIKPSEHTPFGWVRVRGFIDGYELKKFKLMPKGDGTMFISVKAAIRKKIKKEAGDQVHVRLWLDELPEEIPEEIKECLLNESRSVLERFLALSEFEKNIHLNPIYDAKTEEEKADRIVEVIKSLTQ